MDFSGSMFNIYSKHDILPDLYYYYATKDFSVSICGKVALPNMKYIHELQHLLFGLGLNSEMEVESDIYNRYNIDYIWSIFIFE